ncbi:MAG: DNA polymerase III subunit alpha, partial [Patescibacteria group bacterium]|nr:DNA polymerase III subunit alpha [Patescibacteria group bacterium]
MKFTHLHTHSHYSLLDGLAKIDDLIDKAIELNMDSLALTDHGVMYGIIEFYQKAKAKNIKPILGVEAYVATGSRYNKNAGVDNKRNHLILLAKNETGYKNLIKLTTSAHLEGFYYKPRIDKELLRKYSEGIIASSACIAGEVPRAILSGDLKKAEKIIGEFQEIFGKENFYLELQHHPSFKEQEIVNKALIDLSKITSAPLVAANDVHYINAEDDKAQDILMCIQMNRTVNEKDRLSMVGDDYSLKSQETMIEQFKHIPEAIDNTQRIVEACNVEIGLGKILLPYYKVPGDLPSDEYLEKLCRGEIGRRYGKTNEEIEKRLQFELDTIKKMGFDSYFLIVQDFVNWSKKEGIIVGPGRGSAAGSIVSYLIGITDIDPLKYNLLFERFLNPDRISMPDIDLDFADNRRDEVLKYVSQKYGEDHVAQIITFGTMAARAAIRDTGRALGLPYSFCDKIAKAIPMFTKLPDALANVKELKDLYSSNSEAKNLIDNALKLEGVARHSSTHACGVVISKNTLNHYTPCQFPPQNNSGIVTQYEMHNIEDLGLLKMDFLGLKNLTVLENALKIISKTKEDKIDLSLIPLNDEKTLKLFQQGKTTGVFQFESSGMKRYLKKLEPTDFEDVIAMVALYRPGPLNSGMVDEFIDRKHGKKKIVYKHPIMENALKNTYGIIVYQEQVMRLSKDMANFTGGQADTLRKAMGKKIAELMAKMKEEFIKGCLENDISEKIAKETFSDMEKFAEYGFNRCLTGDTIVIDSETGKQFKLEELYKIYKKDGRLPSILTLKENYKLGASKIMKVYDNGTKEIYQVKTRLGRIIKATSNHPFKTINGWENLENLESGDMIGVARCVPINKDIKKAVKDHPILNGTVKKTTARGSKDIIPVQIKDLIRTKIRQSGYSLKEFSKKYNIAERLFFDETKKRGYLRETVEVIGKILKDKEILELAQSDIYWDEIVEIKKIGKEKTFDLTIERTHNFVANDIIVHNSHAVCYAFIGYQTAYLKAHYPAEFMASLLTADQENIDRVAIEVDECRQMGIEVLPPDVNKSFINFGVINENKKEEIRFGLSAIKNVGHNIVETIVKERKENGEYESIEDFVLRVESRDLNKKSMESLIKTGAFDSMEERSKLLANMERILNFAKEHQQAKNNGQVSLFGDLGSSEDNINKLQLTNAKLIDKKERMAWEKELLGLYVSDHPLKEYSSYLRNNFKNIK